MSQALTAALWQPLDETTRAHRLAWGHDGMAQRWLVVASQAALERAAVRGTTAQQRAWDASEKHRVHGPAQRFEPPEAAHAALATRAKAWRSHQVEPSGVSAHTLGWPRAADLSQPEEGDWVAEARPSAPGPRAPSVPPATGGVLG
jgi:hypothetical protein